MIGDERIKWDDLANLRRVLVGRSIYKADDEHLVLDDGTRLRLVGNEGCGGCPNGEYALTWLGECHNAVTNVTVSEELVPNPDAPDYDALDRRFSLFVIAEDKRFPIAEFEGTDGNGYYGTGFWVEVEGVDGERPGEKHGDGKERNSHG